MTFTVEQAVDVLGALNLTDEEIAEVATTVLRNRGFAVKVFGRADVAHRVNQLDHLTAENKENVINHILQGDDWQTMEEETYLEDGNFWALINGTKNDHPEWFAMD